MHDKIERILQLREAARRIAKKEHLERPTTSHREHDKLLQEMGEIFRGMVDKEEELRSAYPQLGEMFDELVVIIGNKDKDGIS
jgi:hypothetical protein